jgi:hypothetical protein
MLLYLPQKKLLYMSTLLLSGLFWTPFPTLVLGCIYLIRVLPSLVSKNKKFLFQFFTVNSFLAAFLVLFLVANQTSTGIEFTLTTTDRWINYLWLIVGEILIFYLLLEPEHRKKKVVRAVMILLLILPLWKLGMGNDLYSRASLPLLMILYIYFLKSLKVASSLQTARWVVLLLVALLPLKYLGDNLRHFSLKPHYTPNTKYDTYDLIERDYQSIEVANQYLMDQHSVFYRYLLDKKIVPQNSPGDQH